MGFGIKTIFDLIEKERQEDWCIAEIERGFEVGV